MRSGGGKAKGSEFERSISKSLSLWITNNKRDDCFWRSAASGGRATIQFKKGKENRTQTGDITAIDPIGAWLTDRFIIENKNYKSLDIDSGIISNTGRLHKFWVDLVAVSNKINKLPMLIGKESYRPILLILSSKGAASLRLDSQTAVAILPLWDNARIYLFSSLLETECMAGYNVEVPTSSRSLTGLARSE